MSVKKVKSKSVEGLGYSIIEFNFGTDMQKAMSDVENAISRIDFPDDTKKPKITKAEFYDTVTRIVLSANIPLSELIVSLSSSKNSGRDFPDSPGCTADIGELNCI